MHRAQQLYLICSQLAGVKSGRVMHIAASCTNISLQKVAHYTLHTTHDTALLHCTKNYNALTSQPKKDLKAEGNIHISLYIY